MDSTCGGACIRACTCARARLSVARVRCVCACAYVCVSFLCGAQGAGVGWRMGGESWPGESEGGAGRAPRAGRLIETEVVFWNAHRAQTAQVVELLLLTLALLAADGRGRGCTGGTASGAHCDGEGAACHAGVRRPSTERRRPAAAELRIGGPLAAEGKYRQSKTPVGGRRWPRPARSHLRIALRSSAGRSSSPVSHRPRCPFAQCQRLD